MRTMTEKTVGSESACEPLQEKQGSQMEEVMFKQSLEVGIYFLEQICHLQPTPKHIWSKWLLFHPSSFFPILLFLLLKRECFYPGTYCLLLKSQALKPQVLLWFKMYGTCISKVIWLSRSAFFYKETNKILKVKKKVTVF